MTRAMCDRIMRRDFAFSIDFQFDSRLTEFRGVSSVCVLKTAPIHSKLTIASVFDKYRRLGLNLGFVVFVEILDANWYSQFVSQLQVGDITMMEVLITSKLSNSRWTIVSIGFWLISACVWYYWMRTGVLQRLKSTLATDSCNGTSQHFNFVDFVKSAVLSKTVLVNSSQLICASGAGKARQNEEGLTVFSVVFVRFFSTLNAGKSTAIHHTATCTRLQSHASNDTAFMARSGFGLEVLSELFCGWFHCVFELYFQGGVCDMFRANTRSVDWSILKNELLFSAKLLMGQQMLSANSNHSNTLSVNGIAGQKCLKSTLRQDKLFEAGWHAISWSSQDWWSMCGNGHGKTECTALEL